MHRIQWMRNLTICVVCLALAGTAAAQADADGSQDEAAGSTSGQTQDSAALSSESNAPDQSPANPTDAEQTTLAELERRLAELELSNETLLDQVDLLKAEVRRLNQEVGRLVEGGSAGTVLGNMALTETLDEQLARAVQGQVVINNQTDATQTFYLNGTRWQVPAGKYQVWVPLGRVVANVSGEPPQQFSADRWKLIRDHETGSPRHYRLRLAIGEPGWQTVQPAERSAQR